jgi:hypothetical protein
MKLLKLLQSAIEIAIGMTILVGVILSLILVFLT